MHLESRKRGQMDQNIAQIAPLPDRRIRLAGYFEMGGHGLWGPGSRHRIGRTKVAGGIAQLVEHELCKLGATGSNPVASTNLKFEILDFRRACSSVC